MNPSTPLRVTLCLVVALTFLVAGTGAASACAGEYVECSIDHDVDRDGSSNYLSAGGTGGADLTDPQDATTDHDVYVDVNTGIGDVGVDLGAGNA